MQRTLTLPGSSLFLAHSSVLSSRHVSRVTGQLAAHLRDPRAVFLSEPAAPAAAGQRHPGRGADGQARRAVPPGSAAGGVGEGGGGRPLLHRGARLSSLLPDDHPQQAQHRQLRAEHSARHDIRGAGEVSAPAQQQRSTACSPPRLVCRIRSRLPLWPRPLLLSYLFFQAHDEVVGVWCYEQQELQQAAAALNRIVSSIQDPNFRPQPPSQLPQQPAPAKAAAASSSAASASTPSKSSVPHRKPPPVIQTQPGKRLHARAPPPPSLQYGPALADGNERSLQARLSAFMRAFDEEDNAYAAAHEQAVQAQKAGKVAEAAQMLSVEQVEQKLAASRKPADNGRSGDSDGDGSLHPLLSQLFQQSQQQQQPAANHSAQLQHSASDSQLHPLVSSLFQHSLAASTTPAAPAAPYPAPSSSAAASSPSIPMPSPLPPATFAAATRAGLSVEPDAPALLSPAAFLPTASAAPFSILLNGSASSSVITSSSSLPPLYLSLPPPPPHLSLSDFRLHLQRLLSDESQLRAWYDQYSAHRRQ